VVGVALIRERRLFESDAYFNYGKNTEGTMERNISEARTWYAQFSIKYVLILTRNKTQTAVTNMKLNKRIAKKAWHSLI